MIATNHSYVVGVCKFVDLLEVCASLQFAHKNWEYNEKEKKTHADGDRIIGN
jgi:hypothetical protein